MGRETNTFKPLGSGHCGAVRIVIDALPVGASVTLTPSDTGAENLRQVLDGLTSSRKALSKKGKRFTHMQLDGSYWVKRLA